MTPDTREDARNWRRAIAIVVGLTVVQLVISALVPLDGDETYYWEWSRRLAPGYFDHPPAIAFLIRAGRQVLGDTYLGVRLFSNLAHWGGMIVLIALARRLGGGAAALRAALGLACLAIPGWLWFATPDGPLFLAGAAALYAVVRAIEAADSRGELRWWVAAGLALGISLLSKEMAVLLPAGVLVALVSEPMLRRRLVRPGPYIACAIALVMFAPVVVWNAAHDWPVRFQLEHGLGASRGGILNRELELILGQVAIAGGILFVMMMIATVRALRPPRDPVRYLLAVVTLTTFAVFCLSAIRQRVGIVWPAPAYTTAILLLATAEGGRRWKTWLRGGYIVGGILLFFANLHLFVPIRPRQSGGDVLRRGHGWDVVARHTTALRARTPATPGQRLWLAANSYQDASELAFHLPDHPTLFSLNIADRSNQYALWPRFPDLAHPGDHLIFLDERTRALRNLEPHFEEVQLMDQMGPTPGEPEMPARRLWLLRGWRGSWPSGER